MNQDNEKKPPASAVLRCSGCGNLTPADIRKECEDCSHNYDFECAGGLPAVLLTGSRDNIANAVSKKGILFGEVVVVNAQRYEAMEREIKLLRDAIDKIAEEKEYILETNSGAFYPKDKDAAALIKLAARTSKLSLADHLVEEDEKPEDANAETCGVEG